MKARIIGAIYAKELRDLIRDRRAVISTVVIPTVIMPMILFTFGKVASSVVSQAKAEIPRVMVIGGAGSPGIVAQMRETGKLKVEDASPNWRALVAEKKVRAVVELPGGFEKALESGSAPAVTLYDYRGELKSSFAEVELNDFFTKLRTKATAALLARRGLPATIAKPFEIKQENVAPPEKVGGNLLGGIIPYFVMFLCLSGAMYPAMDLTAGEKERGTLETLLCSPAGRTEIVLGKFLAVLTASLTSVGLAMLSMVATVAAVGSTIRFPDRGGRDMAAMVDPLGVLGVLAMVLPVAVLLSAVAFSISLFAKSMKEAQTYLVPLTLLVLIPCVVGMIPGIDLTMSLSLIPIVNVSLVCKEMLSGVWHWGYIALIFASTAAYAAAALAFAVAMFRREGVIFRT